TRAARPGDDGDLVARELNVDALQVVLPGTFYGYLVHDVCRG
ncbi:MAG: hypothetical protein H6Q55_3583, partial [Deltaproteobacteria bacterium]|nr:hypothetical protein [Deltaproteobacteria bacterium]